MTAKHSIRFHSAQPEKRAALWGKEKGLLWQEERNDNLSAEFHRRAETYNIIRKATGPTFSGKFTSSPANLLAFLLGFYYVCTLNRPEGGSPGFFQLLRLNRREKSIHKSPTHGNNFNLIKKNPPEPSTKPFFSFPLLLAPTIREKSKNFSSCFFFFFHLEMNFFLSFLFC